MRIISTSTNASKKKSNPNEIIKDYKCSCCDAHDTIPTKLFYMSKNHELFGNNDKYVPICKECLAQLFDKISRRTGSDKLALMACCHYLDVVYVDDIYETIKAMNTFNLGNYLRALNGVQYKNKNFTTSLLTGICFKSPEQVSVDRETKWEAIDIINKRDVIAVVGYDPFEDYPEADRKFLFNELSKYIDEDIKDDVFMLSQLMQIVNNNNQVRKYDFLINKYSADDESITKNSENIKQLTALKKEIIGTTDKIARENEISLKNRSNKEAGKSSLGSLQKKFRELGFKEAESNYYKQLSSAGTQWAIDMSHKSIVQNTMFDENDKKEIFEIQRVLVLDLQKKLNDELEKNRLLQIQLDEFQKEVT